VEDGPFRNRQGAGVDITDKAGLTVEPDFFGSDGTTDDSVDIDVTPFQMRIGLAGLADRQRSGTRQLAFESTIDTNAVVDLHDTLEDRVPSDDGVESLTATSSGSVVFFSQHGISQPESQPASQPESSAIPASLWSNNIALPSEAGNVEGWSALLLGVVPHHVANLLLLLQTLGNKGNGSARGVLQSRDIDGRHVLILTALQHMLLDREDALEILEVLVRLSRRCLRCAFVETLLIRLAFGNDETDGSDDRQFLEGRQIDASWQEVHAVDDDARVLLDTAGDDCPHTDGNNAYLFAVPCDHGVLTHLARLRDRFGGGVGGLVNGGHEIFSQCQSQNLSDVIGGNNALLTYKPSSAGLMTPSAGYTFSWTGNVGSGNDGMRVKRFRMEHLASDRVEIEMSYDQKLVAADLGCMIGGILL